MSHLLFFDIGAEQERKPRQIDVRTNGSLFVRAMEWSEDDAFVYLQSAERAILVELQSHSIRCESVPDQGAFFDLSGGFIGKNMYIALGMSRDYSTKNWIYDSMCSLLKEAASVGRARASAVAGSLIAASSRDNPATAVTDALADRAVLSVPDRRLVDSLAFAKSASILCSGRRAWPGDGSLYCWKVGDLSIDRLSRYQIHNGGSSPVVGSAKTAAVMFPEESYRYNGFTENSRRDLKRYIIWDAEAGKAIAYIPPARQRPWSPYENMPRLVKSDVFALSPDDKLAAVAVEDGVRIYRIPSR